MKRLITGLLAITTLLVSSCGNSQPTIVKRHHVVIFYIDRNNPLYVSCDMISDGTNEKYNWEGAIHTWIPDNNLSYYFSGYLYEYSNGMNVAIYGTKRG